MQVERPEKIVDAAPEVKKEITINELDKELIALALGYLDTTDLVSTSLVNKSWNVTATHCLKYKLNQK